MNATEPERNDGNTGNQSIIALGVNHGVRNAKAQERGRDIMDDQTTLTTPIKGNGMTICLTAEMIEKSKNYLGLKIDVAE